MESSLWMRLSYPLFFKLTSSLFSDFIPSAIKIGLIYQKTLKQLS